MERRGSFKSILFKINDGLLSFPAVVAIRKAMICSIPVFLVSSFSNILIAFPIYQYQVFLQGEIGKDVLHYLSIIQKSADALVGILVAAAVAHYYVQEVHPKNTELAWISSVLSIVNYGVMVIDHEKGQIMAQLGVNTMFISFISGLLSPILFLWMYDHEFFGPKKSQRTVDPTWWWTIKSGPACIVIGAVILTLTYLFCSLTHITSIYNGFYIFFNKVLPIKNAAAEINAVLLIVLRQILCLLGMNGGVLTREINFNYFEPLLMENIDAATDGLTPKNIVNSDSIGMVTSAGGAGMGLALVIAILLVSVSARKKWLAKFSMLPAIFNISEILQYGVPLAFSPIYAIPFMIIPLINFFIYWVLAKVRLIPMVVKTSDWILPYFVQASGQLGVMTGPVFITLLLVLDVLIYIPFVKLSDEYDKYVFQRDVAELTKLLQQSEEKNIAFDHLSLPNRLRTAWEILVNDLSIDLKQGHNIQMYYQPQIDIDGRCIGAEALLRWKQELVGFVYPPLVIAVAKNGEILEELEAFIFNEAAKELSRLERNNHNELKISVNITATSLLRDNLVEMLDDVVRRYGIKTTQLWIELTEQDAITSPQIALQRLETLKNKGYKLLIDDFGMGHTSLKYLQFGMFDTIKLDGSLTRNIAQEDANNSTIIASITKLAEKFNLGIVAEYVESMNQKKMLEYLGVRYFQGYLISKPLDEVEFRTFLESREELK